MTIYEFICRLFPQSDIADIEKLINENSLKNMDIVVAQDELYNSDIISLESHKDDCRITIQTEDTENGFAKYISDIDDAYNTFVADYESEDNV